MTKLLHATMLIALALMLAVPASAAQKKGAACGGVGIPPGAGCSGSAFCQAPTGQCFILAGGTGTCTRALLPCVNINQPVCGCDGKTYRNNCLRIKAKVSLLHGGAC